MQAVWFIHGILQLPSPRCFLPKHKNVTKVKICEKLGQVQEYPTETNQLIRCQYTLYTVS